MASSKSSAANGPSPNATKSPLTLSDLCDDVLLMIYDHLEYLRSEPETPIKCLSQTNHRLHDLLAPMLFKTLHVNAPIKLLRQNQLLHHHAQALKIDMFGSMWWWCSGVYVSGSDAVDLFRLVHDLDALATLEISMMRRSTDIFAAAFRSVGDDDDVSVFTLDTIETLAVSSSAAFLAHHCPNLKTLAIQDGGDCSVEVYSDLASRLAPLHTRLPTALTPHLTRFSATAMWAAPEISFLTRTFPHLQRLHMRSETYCYRASVSTIMALLGEGLQHLSVLELSKIGHLDMDFRSVWKRRIQECNTDAIRKRLWRENECLRVEAENKVARMAFAWIRGLREVCVGEHRVARRMARDRYGQGGGLKWLWERKGDGLEDCVAGSVSAKYKAERDAVVVHSELGT